MCPSRIMAVGVLAAGVLVGCAVNPVTGRRSVMLVSASQEREWGAQEAARVAATLGVVEHDLVAPWVAAVGRRLVAGVPGGADYRFQVVDSEVPNAFALPGGWVYVSRGLLALVNAEDELAGVLGHEIGHVVARHAAARTSAGAPLRVVTGIGAVATDVVAPRLGRMVGGLGDVAGELVLQQYGRQQEREADEIGQRLAAEAGWDPGGLPAFLRTLAREEQLTTGRVRRTAFLSSHPATPDRIEDTEARARDLARDPGAPIAAGRDAVLARLEGLVVGPDPAAGFVVDGRFLHPDLDLVVVFPDGWEIRNVAAFAEGEAPDGAVRVAIQVAEGADPMTAARTFAAASDVAYAEGPTARPVHGRLAVQALTVVGTGADAVAVRLAWIASGERVVLLSGMTRALELPRQRATIEVVLGSARPLAATERAAIRVTRLTVVRARANERLADLVVRTESAWPAPVVAVANALGQDRPLDAGAAVKIARTMPYR